MSVDDIRSERLKKLDSLKSAGIDPYPAESERTHDNVSFQGSFDNLLDSGEKVTLGGRIMSLRHHGGLVFVDLFDGTGRVQTILKKDEVGEQTFHQFLDFVGVSDFIEVTGVAFITKRGMNSLLASSWRMTTKSIRQVPDEWFGLKDEDERYRKRYIDMLLNPNVAELIKKRSVFWNAIRSFMLERDFIEVETPILETKPVGAVARQFIAHHNALDIDVYLRISPELWHKRLLIGGLPKVFEIGRVFRNEGMSYEHAQDYTVFEFYQAYQDAREGVPMCIDLYRHAAKEAFGTLQFSIYDFKVDLGAEWQIIDFHSFMNDHYGFDPREATVEIVRRALDGQNISYDVDLDVKNGVILLWKQIQKKLSGPLVLAKTPSYLAPLGKKSQDDPRVMDEYKFIIAGGEVGHCFNELNDPVDQLERLEQQQFSRSTDTEKVDYDHVEALEYGMPPTFGLGLSERFFSFLAGISIREAQSFPLMKPQ
jgi:lysyl-tRNA synthetase class 2